MSEPIYSIGDVKARLAISQDTLRYYERIGLLGPVPRTPAGQRRYGEQHLARLSFIRRAQSMDFSLAEIAELLTMRDDPVNSRDDARKLAQSKVVAIQDRIALLELLRQELNGLVDQCIQEGPGPCPILVGLDNADSSTPGDSQCPSKLP